MKAKFAVPLLAACLAAPSLLAQGTSVPDQPPPAPATAYPYPAYPYGYGYAAWPRYGHVAGEISFPYATNFNAAGISGELGAIYDHNFFGGEISYFGGNYQGYDVFDGGGNQIGHFRAAQEITTVEFAYRYFMPLWGGDGPSPVAVYIGAGGGIGFVDYTNAGNQFGFHNDNNGEPAGEVVVGLQFNVGPGMAVRLGYRYMGIDDAWQLDHRSNIYSNVIEAGLAFRF
jgi:opacity protein-like surface antigen